MMENRIDTGKFDQLATLSTREASKDAVGGLTFTVTEYADAWVWFIPKSGGESEKSARETSTRKADFWLYHREDTEVTDVITLDGEQWNITFLDKWPRGWPRRSIMKAEAELIQ